MAHERRGIDFVRSKIKGTVAEIIFQHMFAERDFATVILFGYEHLAPTFAQYQHVLASFDEIADIRDTLDFLLIKPDHKHAVLTDVKYRRRKDPARVKEMATKIHKYWKSTLLFLATQEGFIFSPCSVILEQGGTIPPLNTDWIPQDDRVVIGD